MGSHPDKDADFGIPCRMHPKASGLQKRGHLLGTLVGLAEINHEGLTMSLLVLCDHFLREVNPLQKSCGPFLASQGFVPNYASIIPYFTCEAGLDWPDVVSSLWSTTTRDSEPSSRETLAPSQPLHNGYVAMHHNQWLYFGGEEIPFATYFDGHQGYRVLTHNLKPTIPKPNFRKP